MRTLLTEAGRSALVAFMTSMMTFGAGILAAPNYDQAKLLTVAALIASCNAATQALSVLTKIEIPGKYGPIITAGVRTGLSTFFVLVTGVYAAPDLDTAKSAAAALVVAVATSALTAAVNAMTKGHYPAPDRGLEVTP